MVLPVKVPVPVTPVGIQRPCFAGRSIVLFVSVTHTRVRSDIRVIIAALRGWHVDRISLPVPHLGIALSRGVIVAVLAVTTVAGLLRSRAAARAEQAAEPEPVT